MPTATLAQSPRNQPQEAAEAPELDRQVLRIVGQICDVLSPSSLGLNGSEQTTESIHSLSQHRKDPVDQLRHLVNEFGGEIHVYLRGVQGALACSHARNASEAEQHAPWRSQLTASATQLLRLERRLDQIGGINKVFERFEALREQCKFPVRGARAAAASHELSSSDLSELTLPKA